MVILQWTRKSFNRRTSSFFISLCVPLLLMLGCNNLPHPKTKLPNVVFLLADDMGYGDFEKIGGSTKTPNLNRLAESGVFLITFTPQGPTAPILGLGL